MLAGRPFSYWLRLFSLAHDPMPPYAFLGWPDGRPALEQDALTYEVLGVIRLEFIRLSQGGSNVR